LTPASQGQSLLAHAAQCDHCGALLRQATEDLGAELSPEEQTVLSRMESSKAEWQQDLAHRLGATTQPAVLPRPARRRWFALPAWSYAAAAVAAVAVVAVILWRVQPGGPDKAERLLAQAYTEQRTLELRFRGAGHAPVRLQRGRSRENRPAALPEAEALISRRLAASPNDPAWVAAQARFDLLQWNYEAAIQGLQRALALQPGSPDMLTDLASAYFERAEAVGLAGDYGSAVEYLGQALAKRPGDPVVLFNRAIALERMHQYQQALQAWEAYLKVDPQGDWAGEARQRLQDLRQKMAVDR
jgi:tetratricopeptide (TPR) repeat protein